LVVEDMSRPVLLNHHAPGQAQSLAELWKEGETSAQLTRSSEVSIQSYFAGDNFSRIVLPILEQGGCLALP